MLVLSCALLTLAALLYLFWLTPEPVRAKSPAERDREFLEEKREQLYDNLRDLHLEFRMGKLSDGDYQQMKALYQEELAGLLAQLEALGGGGTSVPPVGAVPGRCLRCGKDNPAANRFCGACGAELSRVEKLP
jgi:hypothetical protein